MRVVLHSAGIQDRDGAALAIDKYAAASLGSNWSGRMVCPLSTANHPTSFPKLY